MSMYKRISIVIVSLLMAILGKAHSVSGVVIDEQTKEPLLGVYVTLINDSAKVLMSSTTNGNGWFWLSRNLVGINFRHPNVMP
uniref:carboxypeptidase-like regulatory domain-containing protein n=1 Tax=Candidatus Limisoma sp. TaxID=3076476 RepID=UPI0040267088